jgi:hypothetical protein
VERLNLLVTQHGADDLAKLAAALRPVRRSCDAK